jgi:predicted DNA-binding antitoxin AbrB/MazE fold protein
MTAEEGYMLLTIEGYFEDGHFIPDTPFRIPEGKKTIITVLDEIANKETEQKAYKKLWEEIIDEIENSDEVLEGEPECLHFRTPEETEAL